MRFFIVALFVGLAVGSPIGQVEVTTTLPQDLLRSDLDLAADDATTVIVEIFADDATAASVTDRARQAPAAGTEDESNEDNEEEEGTTAAPGAASGLGASASDSSSQVSRNKPQPAIPQPLANSSNFLAEYQFSTQFNLGPKDEKLPLSVAPGQVGPVDPIPQIGQVPAAPPVAQVGQGSAPILPPAVPATPQQQQPLSAGAVPASNTAVPAIVAAGEDEDDAESDEDVLPTEAPSARLQQQQQVDAQRIEESDSDNEITNDDVTTVKSFASEYEYTIQQLGASKRRGETSHGVFPTTKLTSPLHHHHYQDHESSLLVPMAMSVKQGNQEHVSLYARNDTSLHNGGDLDFESGGVLSDGEGRAACECGRLPFRVPIGSESEINLRPWTVAIVRGGLIAGGRPHCAGVLINDRYVLTSASCMDGLHPNGIQVWLTAHNTLYNHHLNVGTSKLNVQEVIVHPNYHRSNKDNDIALIKMTQPVDISTSSSYFTPICLPSATHVDYANRNGQIFGWGYSRVNRICTAEVPILDNGVCKRDTRHGSAVTENMMCAGFLTPINHIRTEDCIGDAGSPLTVQLNGRMSLIGITSWGFEFHHRGHNPTVYTRVSGYADWILHNTEDADWCVG